MGNNTWDIVVVGSGGGPDETNLSAYLLKPCDSTWEDGIVAVEAGSGMGALHRILKNTPDLFGPRRHESIPPLRYSASEIYSYIRCFLITHAHLDHVSGMVLSAGSIRGSRKRIHATQRVLKDIETIFSDRLWPSLASWDEDDEAYKFLYNTLPSDSKYTKVTSSISVCTMPLSHGKCVKLGSSESSAFFFRHDPTLREFLFFGDVEPDSLAEKPQTIHVWRTAAAKFPKTLSSIFIECSWPSGRPDDTLYGHLTPDHLVEELTALATEVVRSCRTSQREARNGSSPARKKQKANPIPEECLRGALDGLRVHIIHCKANFEDALTRPINHVITDQVRALVEERGLGAEVLAVDQGMRINM